MSSHCITGHQVTNKTWIKCLLLVFEAQVEFHSLVVVMFHWCFVVDHSVSILVLDDNSVINQQPILTLVNILVTILDAASANSSSVYSMGKRGSFLIFLLLLFVFSLFHLCLLHVLTESKLCIPNVAVQH